MTATRNLKRYILTHCLLLSGMSIAFWTFVILTTQSRDAVWEAGFLDLPGTICATLLILLVRHNHALRHHTEFISAFVSLGVWNLIGVLTAIERVRNVKRVISAGNLYAGFWIVAMLFGCLSVLAYTPEQIRKDTLFMETQLKPAVKCAEELEAKIGLGKLKEEYAKSYADKPCPGTLRVGTLYTDDGAFTVPEGSWALDVWRGEWSEYYLKWENRYIWNDTTWAKSIRYAVQLAVTALAILVIWSYCRMRIEKDALAGNQPH